SRAESFATALDEHSCRRTAGWITGKTDRTTSQCEEVCSQRRARLRRSLPRLRHLLYERHEATFVFRRLAQHHVRIRSLRHSSSLLRTCIRGCTSEPASVRRPENIPAVFEPVDDGQDVDGGKSRSARAVSQSRDDRPRGAHAAETEAPRAEAQVCVEAGARVCFAEGRGVAKEGWLWGADQVLAAWCITPHDRRPAVRRHGKAARDFPAKRGQPNSGSKLFRPRRL